MVPETRMASPVCAFRAEMLTPSGTKPTPAVLIRIPPAYLPAASPALFSAMLPSITFVSPATIRMPASRAVSAIECAISRTRSISVPSSRIQPHVRYFGTAPRIRRSFTVPQTARRPMSPPRNFTGVTTKLSVVSASLPQPATSALSSISSSV